jgi:hypothetical protein
MALDCQIVNRANCHEDESKRENPLVPGCFVLDKINADLNEYRQEDKGR